LRLRDELLTVDRDIASFGDIEPISLDRFIDSALDEADVPARSDETDAIATEFLAQHYSSWPDTPLPALGGLTPRGALAKPAERRRLISMLRDFDADSERRRRAGEVAYDFTPIWRDLGLERSRLLR
jgi:hypothetical protein